MVALPDERSQHHVLGGRFAHVVQQFAFRQRLAEIQRLGLTNAFRHRLVNQRIQRPHTKHLKHLCHFVW